VVAPIAQFSQQARAVSAQSFVTVNYGSGTPAEAAAWVAQAKATAGQGVALWEVGNENYGCWEVNNELAGPPENFAGYTPNTYTTVNGVYENPACPQTIQGSAAGTQTLATSYAVGARQFLQAMKAADPTARIGVPWAFSSEVRTYPPDSRPPRACNRFDTERVAGRYDRIPRI
jgi:alpha-L-arabinofuranosidase